MIRRQGSAKDDGDGAMTFSGREKYRENTRRVRRQRYCWVLRRYGWLGCRGPPFISEIGTNSLVRAFKKDWRGRRLLVRCMKRIVHLRGCMFLLAALGVGAGLRSATQVRAAHASTDKSAAGALIVTNGGSKPEAIACASCHGSDGVSDPSGTFPILAGQSSYYQLAQLHKFASGERPNDVMTPIAKALSDEEMENVAEYYASARPKPAGVRHADPNLVLKGHQIAHQGSFQNRLQACVNCHGPNGTGESPSVPYLSGQYRQYLEAQLRMFRTGERRGDEMTPVGHALTSEQAAAVAAYFDQLPLPSLE